MAGLERLEIHSKVCHLPSLVVPVAQERKLMQTVLSGEMDQNGGRRNVVLQRAATQEIHVRKHRRLLTPR